MITIEELMEEQPFIICRLMSSREFIRFCGDRGVKIDREKLELYEKLQIFCPIVRVEFPKFKEKIEINEEGNSYRSLGTLKNDEDWSGQTKDTYGQFWWQKEKVRAFFEAGLLWLPKERSFVEWESYYDKELHHYKVESYYSEFQIYSLNKIEQSTTMQVSLVSWSTFDAEAIAKLISQTTRISAGVINSFRTDELARGIADVCQLISNRYFPETQSDRRTINISKAGENRDWSWEDYRVHWIAKEQLGRVGITAEAIKKYHQCMASAAHFCDPLEDWYDLVQFVSLEKKKKLKNNALLAQTFYEMEMMLRLFYLDLTGDKLSEFRGGNWKERLYGQGVPDNNNAFLEFLTNQYHLNPRPKLILIVEGKSEYEQLPKLARALGYDFDTHGIKIELLQGIGDFTSGKIERFIDHYHNLQTIVYIILDNEDNPHKLKNKMVEKRSRYEANRCITNEDYIFLWDTCFEFDNFTNEEIAKALSSILPDNGFTCDEVAECRKTFGKQKDPLSILFKNKIGRDLNKPLLAERLIDHVIANIESEYLNEKPQRKILIKINEIIELAALNHQPHSYELWRENQESGYLGKKIDKQK